MYEYSVAMCDCLINRYLYWHILINLLPVVGEVIQEFVSIEFLEYLFCEECLTGLQALDITETAELPRCTPLACLHSLRPASRSAGLFLFSCVLRRFVHSVSNRGLPTCGYHAYPHGDRLHNSFPLKISSPGDGIYSGQLTKYNEKWQHSPDLSSQHQISVLLLFPILVLFLLSLFITFCLDRRMNFSTNFTTGIFWNTGSFIGETSSRMSARMASKWRPPSHLLATRTSLLCSLTARSLFEVRTHKVCPASSVSQPDPRLSISLFISRSRRAQALL